MFVDVKIDVETLPCRLSGKLFRGTVNNPLEVMDSQPRCEAVLTSREEDGKIGLLQSQFLRTTPFTGGFNVCSFMF